MAYHDDDFFIDYQNSGRSDRRSGSVSRNTRPGSGVRRSTRRRRRVPRAVRRTLIVGVFVLVLVLLISLIAAIASAFAGVGEVEALTLTEVTSDQVTLSWEKAKRADGYRVKMAQGDAGDFAECAVLDSGDALSATVGGLEQASVYRFSVTPLRGGKEYQAAVLDRVCTLPEAPEITTIFSATKGTIHLDWTENESASGYVVEYKKSGAEYSADAAVTVSDPAEFRTDITDLEVNTDYQVRVYAYLSGDTQVNSAPSAEETVKVVEKDTEVMPKARALKVDESIDPNKPMIALTFDDGPGGESSERILDALEQNNAKATFFMVGCNTTDAADNLKRKVKLGMEIGNHTWNHTHLGSEVVPEDIRMASNEIYNVCGQFPTCFRSPGGMSTQTILNECSAEGMPAYYWSIDTNDWSSRNADSIYHEVMDYVKDGDIVLMHEIYDSTAEAVERMVPELIEQGYQLVTCHDLIACKTGADPVPGVQYVDAYRELAP